METIKIKWKRLLAFFAFVAPLMYVNAQKVTIGGLKYFLDTESQEAIIDNGNIWSGELSIPSEVCYNGQVFVVKSISWAAFYDCSELTKVRIPKTIEYVTHHVLSESDALGAVPDDCMNPFVGCSALESIEVDEENPCMCSVGGVLFSKDKSRLYCYPAGAKATKYMVPDNVTWLGTAVFSYNTYLQSVEMSNCVTRMSGSAFAGCTNLKSVRLSESLECISAYTFDNCESMRIIDIPQSVNRFEESVFRGTNLDALVVRGTFPEALRGDTFYSISDSMIIYAQSSEISKFKKVFSGTILPLENYTDGFVTPKASTASSSLYDLSGRRITQPTKGVNIRKGRKVVK